MTARPIILILPCHSLDDFPTHHEGDEAAGLLANWTAGWHPVWIASAGEPPKWIQVHEADAERLKGSIVLTPKAVQSHLPVDFQETIREAGADRLEDFSDRATLVSAISALQRSSLEDIDPDSVPPELVADFFSLSYWFLQIELLARQISYHSNLDEYQFRDKTNAAAKLAVAGDHEAAKDMLRQCFGLLIEERDHYYPVDAYLLDVALTAETTTPKQIQAELDRPVPPNLWMTGERLAALKTDSPELCDSIATAVEDGKLGLVGGEFSELPLPLMSAESLRREWLRGLDCFETALGKRPLSYFRRRFGLAPRLASLLGKFGWNGAIHACLDAGKFPSTGQACSQWKDKQSDGLPIVNRVPLDAARPETFLALSVTMGRSMESDYVATTCLARWAGTESEWFDDVRGAAKYGLRLGQTTTCDEYFANNHPDLHGDAYRLDQYRSAYLTQAVQAGTVDPISRLQRVWRTTMTLEAAERLANMSIALATDNAQVNVEALEAMNATRKNIEAALEQIALRYDTSFEDRNPSDANEAEEACSPDSAARQIRTASQHLAKVVTGQSDLPREESKIAGWLCLNPYSHARRALWDLESESLAINGEKSKIAGDEDSPVYAFHRTSAATQAAIDTSGSGFAWLAAIDKGHANQASRESTGSGKNESLLEKRDDDGFMLRNEFVEIVVSRKSGGIASVFDFHSRGNRLSQRLVAVGNHSGGATNMKCDRIEIMNDSPLLGSITSFGTLVDEDDKTLASFEQTISLARGSRMAKIQIKLELNEALQNQMNAGNPETGSPWKNYVACRWAWPLETDVLHRCAHGVMYETDGRRCESPWLFEINDGKRRTELLTGGLPYHHRCDDRMLDSLLVVPGETCREFELAVAVDLPHPIAQSESYWLPTIAVPSGAAPGQHSGWLFHIGSKHVRVTGYAPIWSDDESGTCVGVRVRLQEQSGGAGTFRLRCPRPIVTASKTDFVQSNSDELTVEDGVVSVKIEPNEWTEVACHW